MSWPRTSRLKAGLSATTSPVNDGDMSYYLAGIGAHEHTPRIRDRSPR
ncbi:hypothetical protein CHELA41_40178 [Hyphomicrobiales bacterium]|nr:hypothetical protein CHELA41_40178 [Hyphomicrobiales bacterium]